MFFVRRLSLVFLIFGMGFSLHAQETPQSKEAEIALRKALAFMQTLRPNGGWAMRWTSDGKMTWGEYTVRPANVVTVQPPATPGVAEVYLRASSILGDPAYRQIAAEAGEALLRGQLDCGGFPHEFSPDTQWEKSGSFDDDVTQGATRFLVKLWKATHEQKFLKAIERCAQFMLDSQYPNGGWPQAFPLGKGYSRYITLNDDAMMDVIRTLFLLYREFGDERYYKAAVRGADCLLALQGKPPQAGWAQQFTPEGEPAPARRFEPVGLTTHESIGVLRVLLEVYEETGDKKYLQAGAPAFEWLKRSILPNGKLARLYRYGDNQPIYSTAEGEIVFDVALARPGYSWQGNYWDPKLPELYERLMKASIDERNSILNPQKPPSLEKLQSAMDPILKSLDSQGRWLSPLDESSQAQYRDVMGDPKGIQSIETGVFVRNANRILDYLECFNKSRSQ